MTHRDLVKRAEQWLRKTRRCLWTITEQYPGWVYPESPDAIGWNRWGESILVECKISRADMLADRRKPHRMWPGRGMGRYRWYMVPEELKAIQVPDAWGLCYAKNDRVYIVKKPKEQPTLIKAEITMIIRRLIEDPARLEAARRVEEILAERKARESCPSI